MKDNNKYTILLCKYTGEVGLVRKSYVGRERVLMCTGRNPPSWKPVSTKDTITLGWVMATSISSAFLKVPKSILGISNVKR